jgi:hypothetical protein
MSGPKHALLTLCAACRTANSPAIQKRVKHNVRSQARAAHILRSMPHSKLSYNSNARQTQCPVQSTWRSPCAQPAAQQILLQFKCESNTIFGSKARAAHIVRSLPHSKISCYSEASQKQMCNLYLQSLGRFHNGKFSEMKTGTKT